MDPAVLRQRNLLSRAGVDVEDADNDHELLVLPDRHIEGLVGDRDRQHDRILAQTGRGSFRHGDLRRLQGRRAEAEDRIAAVALLGARLVLELKHEVHHQLVSCGADLRAIRLEGGAVRRRVGVELDVRRRRAVLLRGRPLALDRRIRAWILGLDLLQVIVDVTRQIAPVHVARQIAALDSDARCRGRWRADTADRATSGEQQQHGSGCQGGAHATYSKGEARPSTPLMATFRPARDAPPPPGSHRFTCRLAREGFRHKDLSNGITLPKLEQRLPKLIDPDELARLLAALPSESIAEKRDRALVQFLISTGCRISEALALDRTDFPRTGNRLIVTGKGSKQRAVYLTADARAALEEYLAAREDACMALFINFDRSVQDDRGRRLTGAGARFIVRRLRKELGAWSFKSPHVARHTTTTTLLEVTGGDVRLVQEVLGHANLNTLQGYTKIVDSRKHDAYRRYQEFLDGKKPPETKPA